MGFSRDAPGFRTIDGGIVWSTFFEGGQKLPDNASSANELLRNCKYGIKCHTFICEAPAPLLDCSVAILMHLAYLSRRYFHFLRTICSAIKTNKS
jgi:hypothetical protein